MKRLLLLVLGVSLVGCSWRGSQKVPIDPVYAECKRTCAGTCTIDGKCLRHEAK